MSFIDIGLQKELADSLSNAGITVPSSIQSEVFRPLKEGASVIALSKTGTGKTLAYLAPLVSRYVYDLASENAKGQAWGLILVPTRELADQAERNLKLLTGNSLKTVVIVGGESEKKQIESGSQAAIYIATPGRFLDLLNRNLVNVSHLKCVVFDEADRILDMGFVNDIRTIRQKLPQKLQLCFFSATIHFGIDEMAYEFGVEAQRIGKEQDELTVEGLDHRVAFVGDEEKFHALVHFIKARPQSRGIVFTNFKERARELVSRLNGLGLHVELLTAQLSQSERSRTMQNFRENKVRILIASDLASRGLDVQDLDFVVNMALPEDSATYLHRVGRTARAGKKGIALSLVGFDDSFRLESLEKFLGKPIARFEFYTNELSGPLPRFQDERPAQVSRPESSQRSVQPSNRADQKRGAHPPRQNQQPRTREVQHVRPQQSQNTKATQSPIQKSFWKNLVSKFQNLFGIKKESPSTNVTKKSDSSSTRAPYVPHHKRPHNKQNSQGARRKYNGPHRGKAHSSK